MEKHTFRRTAAAIAFAVLAAPAAGQVEVKALHWSESPRPCLLVDFSSAPDYRISRSENRLNIELREAAPVLSLVQPPARHPAASHIGAMADKARHGVTLVVEMKTKTVPRFRTETLSDGQVRLVVQWPPGGAEKAAKAADKPVKSVQSRAAGTFVVTIDAGHGGKDTGAIGPSGVQEKDVTLAIARKLAALVRNQPGMKPILIRSGDQFVDLHRRADLARLAHADLFISLHADAYEDGGVRGSSIFTLSETGASSEAARTLADHENGGTVAGVQLADKNPELASVLVDLSKSATLDASDQAAARVLQELKKEFPVHHAGVQKAGFAVLKSLDVPSMLVETAFISNPAEERNLANPKHQDRIAQAVFQGIRAYAQEVRGERLAKTP
jgi:N-acetylmuramoyl-L-alanine amidase